MASVVANRAYMTTATTGTGTITLGSAMAGYQSFDAAGIVNGNTVSFTIIDGLAWEVSTGVYIATGTMLTRVLEESSTGSLLVLTGSAKVFITLIAADLQIGNWDTAYTTANAALPKAGGIMTGNITMPALGTVDSRDLSVDGDKLDLIAASANNYVHPNHSGEVTSTADGATVIADNIVDEANLKVSNAPTDGYFLSAQSANAGGLTWAANAGGASALTVDTKSAAYTVVSGDLGKIINFSSGSSADATLPDITTVSSGFHVSIWNTAGTAVSISVKPAAGQQIGSSSGNGFTSIYPFILAWGAGVNIVSDGTYWHISDAKIYGNYRNSLAIGSGATAINNYALAIGPAAYSSAIYSIAIGSSTSQTTASGSNSVAIGSGAQAVVGSGAMALGNSRASGADSFAAAIANNTSSYGATGANSVAIGYRAKATNADGVAIGDTALASGQGSLSLGSYAEATATGSLALSTEISGYKTQATASYAVAMGNRALSSINSKFAYSGGAFSANGDAQTGTFVLRSDTTDATPEALTTSNTAAGTTNQIILPNNSVYGFTGTVIAREDSSSTNDFAVWEIKGGAVRGANAASTTLGSYNINKISESTGAANWSIALSADTTNGAVAITVTGEAAHNIRWVATVNTTEVTY